MTKVKETETKVMKLEFSGNTTEPTENITLHISFHQRMQKFG